ncbi:hypothetical protein [Maridesulfovibrio zosterae]|uniref:hypothetical protein n=1 Tax=Maridesulfovibrio zosterae TaxID=82171 RepID=UPI000421E6A6|nr:hypothetical protein [Maridesulfovibrio zosterae]
MKYLAAIISLVMHAVIVIIILNMPLSRLDSGGYCLDIDIIDESILSKKKITPEKPALKPFTPKKHLPKKNSDDVQISKKISSKINPIKHAAESKNSISQSKKNSAVISQIKPEKNHSIKARPSTAGRSLPIGRSVSDKAIVLRQGKEVTIGNSTIALKRGSESRSMDSIAAYGFGEDDFRGHYETAKGRQVVIIDARQEHGRLILHDRKTGLIRKLKKAGYGDFIYTYGPSFNEDEPVAGSIVFLPGDEHWIHRFMWLPESECAEYPVKGRVDVADKNAGSTDNLFIPSKDGRYPAVIMAMVGARIPCDQFAEVARHLSGKGVVVLVVDSLTESAVKKAYKRLSGLAKVDSLHIGLWIRGYQQKRIPRIPKHAGSFGFVILTIDSPAGSLYPERVASVIPDKVPTFIGFRNINVDWKVMVPVMLTGFQSVPHQLKILDETSPASDETGTDLKWVDALSGDFVSSISAWLDSQ